MAARGVLTLWSLSRLRHSRRHLVDCRESEMLREFRKPQLRFRLLRLSIIGLFLIIPVSAFAQTPTLSIGDLTVKEGDTGVQVLVEFPVNLSAPSQQTVSVTVTTQSGTAIGDLDFGAGSQTLTFAPGETARTMGVGVRGDSFVEGTEQFFMNLSNPVNATIARGQAVGTIVDDDALILLSEANVQRAIALDSPLFTRDVFPITNDLNFSSDHRTRVSFFAIGLKLAAGEPASAVTASAEDSQGTVRPLAVEFVGIPPGFDWLTQVILKMNDQPTTGDVKIKISLHGETSNAVLIGVKP